jgi:hypothetical protein
MSPAKTTPVRASARPAAAQQNGRDEADIAVSERLIQRERPIPLAKVLQEFGRATGRKLLTPPGGSAQISPGSPTGNLGQTPSSSSPALPLSLGGRK